MEKRTCSLLAVIGGAVALIGIIAGIAYLVYSHLERKKLNESYLDYDCEDCDMEAL